LASFYRASIEKLRSDNEHLQDELKLLEQRNEDKRKNGLRSKKAESLVEQAGLEVIRIKKLIHSLLDNLQRKIKQIQSEIGELDKESTRFGQEIDIHRAKLGGVHAAQQNNAAIDKQIRVLENRLEKVSISN
jgi:DNA repair exonuclease SbcCD ATPase subunit